MNLTIITDPEGIEWVISADGKLCLEVYEVADEDES